MNKLYKKVPTDPFLVTATACLGVGGFVLTATIYTEAANIVPTTSFSLPQQASVPPVEPPQPRASAIIPTGDFSALTKPEILANALLETTNPAKRRQQVQLGRDDPFAPLFPDREQHVAPVRQPLPPPLQPSRSQVKTPAAPDVREAPQHASRIILKGVMEEEDGKYSAFVQFPEEPSPRSVREGQVVEVGAGQIRIARIENVDTSTPQIFIEENGIVVARNLSQQPIEQHSSDTSTVALSSSPNLQLQEPTSDTDAPSPSIVPVPSLPKIGKEDRAAIDRLPSPPPLSSVVSTDAARPPVERQPSILKQSNPSRQNGNAIAIERRFETPSISTPVSVQERKTQLQQHPPFLRSIAQSRTKISIHEQIPSLEAMLSQERNKRLSQRLLVRKLKLSCSIEQSVSSEVAKNQTNSNWQYWQKIAGFSRE